MSSIGSKTSFARSANATHRGLCEDGVLDRVGVEILGKRRRPPLLRRPAECDSVLVDAGEPVLEKGPSAKSAEHGNSRGVRQDVSQDEIVAEHAPADGRRGPLRSPAAVRPQVRDGVEVAGVRRQFGQKHGRGQHDQQARPSLGSSEDADPLTAKRPTG
jgi:hypothetical protein